MIELTNGNKELAVLVAVKLPNDNDALIEEHLTELEMLADTAGAQTIIKIKQDRYKYDTAFQIGKGKAYEIKELVDDNNISLVIFDDDLTPTQVRNLERLMEKKILDRSGLILDIFAAHAQTKEAKTQVELAQLEYMLPRLTRAWTHLSKQYGGIGTKGPGETQIETDRRLIRTRIAKLKERLEKIESQNITKSKNRGSFTTATLVGYTNAGKSTLINRLTGAGVLAQNKLFATLDSTTRSLDLPNGKPLLISDTVGFIRKLPAHLVASFKSTLNVAREAGIILHVVDLSHDYFEEHMNVVNDTLKQLGCEKKKQVLIFNKVDAIDDPARIGYVKEKFPGAVTISAERGINISGLMEILDSAANEGIVVQSKTFSINDAGLVSKIHSMAEVVSTTYEDDIINIRYKADAENIHKINKIINGKEQAVN